MRGEIRNIKLVYKGGAFGNPDNVGFWVYGKRRDGRTVPCKHEVDQDGLVTIWSDRAGEGNFFEQDITEFTYAEWLTLLQADASATQRLANAILDQRSQGTRQHRSR